MGWTAEAGGADAPAGLLLVARSRSRIHISLDPLSRQVAVMCGIIFVAGPLMSTWTGGGYAGDERRVGGIGKRQVGHPKLAH